MRHMGWENDGVKKGGMSEGGGMGCGIEEGGRMRHMGGMG